MSDELRGRMKASMMIYMKRNLDPAVQKSLTAQQLDSILRCMADWVFKREISKDYFGHVKSINESPDAQTEPAAFMDELKKI